MTHLEEAVSEFDADCTTEITAVDPDAHRPLTLSRRRRPEDGQVERITLRRSGLGPGSGEAQFLGPTAWHLADLMLTAWSAGVERGQPDGVDFVVRFGDGQTITGRASIRRKRERCMAFQLRRLETFRACLCPASTPDEARPLFGFFLSHYEIPPATPAARRARSGASAYTAAAAAEHRAAAL